MRLPEGYIYLDNAAATRVDPEAVEAMLPYFTEVYAVASSQFSHQAGILASEALDASRRTIAGLLKVMPEEVVFTSDATESNNLALKGFAWANRSKGRHIVSTGVEAHSVLQSLRTLEEEGFEVTLLPVDGEGLVDPDDLRRALRPDTVLVSVQWVNQETGVVQDIAALAAVCRERGVVFHTDASWAAGRMELDLSVVPVDMLTLTAGLLHGPKGVAALVRRKGLRLRKLMDGGFNEFDLRPGVENIPGAVGFAKAFANWTEERRRRLAELDRLLEGRLLAIEEAELNGSPTRRLRGILNVSFGRVEGESVILHLDMKGIAVVTGSACFSRSLEPSHVLMAMGHTHERAHGSVRYSLGAFNTEEEMLRTAEATAEVVARLREITAVRR